MADGTVKEYHYPRQGNAKPREPRWAADSLTALLEAYQRSPEFRGRALATQKQTAANLKPLYGLGHFPAVGVKRKAILELRDGIVLGRGPQAGNNFIKAAAAAYSWGRERGWFDHSPLDRVKRIKGGALPAWSEADAETALQSFREPLRRAVVLALHTGQRRGDLVSIRWSQIAGGVIRLKQRKTGVELAIPIHPTLADELERWRAEATAALPPSIGLADDGRKLGTILASRTGQPWPAQSLSVAVQREWKRLGVTGLNVHGLRKLAATRLAEAGCSAHEIAAITGHKTLAQVQHYTRSVDQEKLARAAVARLKLRR